MKMDEIELKLKEASLQYWRNVNEVKEYLDDYIEFEFSLVEDPSDGWLVVHTDTSSQAPLEKVLGRIQRTGYLTSAGFFEVAF